MDNSKNMDFAFLVHISVVRSPFYNLVRKCRNVIAYFDSSLYYDEQKGFEILSSKRK